MSWCIQNLPRSALNGLGRFWCMTVSVHTLLVRVLFGTANFGTVNVNVGAVQSY